MEFEKSTGLGMTRYLLLVFGFTFAMFALSDYHFFGEGNSFNIALGFRGAGLFLTIVAFSLIGRINRFEHTLMLVTVTQLVVFAVYLLKLHILPESESDLQFMTVVLFILVIFLIPNRWKNSLLAACVMLGSYILFSGLSEKPSALPALTLRWIYLGICLCACALFLFGRENSRRKQFASERLLEFMSITDRLTGIYNRGRFEFILGHWIKSTRHNPFSLILFDIDDFKKVNDRYGHTAGDQVLIRTTETVSASIRDDDIFARWGGEEFVILFGGTPVERAAELAERLRKAVEDNPCETGCITISIGVAEYRKDETITELVNRADEKMYEAKRAGKNRVMAGL
jgi:diguanylate cyclase (GGDEF)-like protein